MALTADCYHIMAASGLLPTTFVHNVAAVVHLSDILERNGVHVMEILLRTPEAMSAIPAIKDRHPNMAVGAGTVLSIDQAADAAAAGADFIVSPYYNQELVDWCVGHSMAVVPGVGTITEVSWGYASGLRTFKFFPGNQLGGAEGIRQISEIYADVRYIPTGGLGMKDLAAYSACPAVLACGGTYMQPEELLEAERWDAVEALVRQAISISLGLSVARLAGPCGQLAGVLAGLITPQPASAPSATEGDAPKLILHTNSAERAASYFRTYGFPSTVLTRNALGIPTAIVLDDTLHGYRVQLENRISS